MTTLISKASRDALGIDTVLRGITYATLLLKSVNYSLVELRTETTLEDVTLKGTLFATFTLDYTRESFLTSALNFLEGIIPISNDTPTELFTPVTPATILSLPIPADIPEVTTLEDYVVWLLLEYEKNGLNLVTPVINRLAITTGETATRFFKKFAYSLPYNPKVYNETRNIIEAVDNDGTVVISTLLDNATLMDNAFLVGN